jgi:hypothetical protein
MIEFVKTKLKLFLYMIIAAATAAFAISFAFQLAGVTYGFFEALGTFLGLRVVLFMANPNMPLNDTNVQFMSEQRILWNLASIAITSAFALIKLALTLIH